MQRSVPAKTPGGASAVLFLQKTSAFVLSSVLCRKRRHQPSFSGSAKISRSDELAEETESLCLCNPHVYDLSDLFFAAAEIYQLKRIRSTGARTAVRFADAFHENLFHPVLIESVFLCGDLVESVHQTLKTDVLDILRYLIPVLRSRSFSFIIESCLANRRFAIGWRIRIAFGHSSKASIIVSRLRAERPFALSRSKAFSISL